jgi:hypothetical protein
LRVRAARFLQRATTRTLAIAKAVHRFLLCALVWLSCNAYGGETVWLGPDRSKWPDTEFRKIKNDFGGLLLVTPDTDWRQKWNTPPDTIPRFREAKTAKVGEQLVILTFFVNPKTDDQRTVNVVCGIKVTRPNNTVSVNERNIPCMRGPLIGDVNFIRLSPAVIHFIGEKKDPLGIWVVEVDIEDVNRKTTLNLKTHFKLVGSDG